MGEKVRKKAFIHTLEAVMATFLVIGFVMFLLPSLREPAETGQIERVRMSERLQALDSSGELSAYISATDANLSGLKDKLALEASASYSYAISLASYSAETFAGNNSVDILKGTNDIREVIVYVRNSSGTIIPDTIVWDSSGPKNVLATGATINLTSTPVSASEANISFVSSPGSGEYRYIIRKTETYGDVPDNKAAWASSYIPSESQGPLKPVLTVMFYNS